MAIKQLSVFVENKKGTLAKITDILDNANINIRSFCVADTEEFGILRLIADDTVAAEKLLRAEELTAKASDVVAVAVPDSKGGLNKILKVLDANDINLEYMYSIINGTSDEAYMVFRVDDNAKTEELLNANGVRVLCQEDIK